MTEGRRNHITLPTKVDDDGRIVAIRSISEKQDPELNHTSLSNNPDGQADIDYVQGARFWLITST